MKKQKPAKKSSKVAAAGASAHADFVLICPRCGDTRILPHSKGKMSVEHNDPLEAYYSKRVCENCHLTGYFFPEVPKAKLEQLRKEIKRLGNK